VKEIVCGSLVSGEYSVSDTTVIPLVLSCKRDAMVSRCNIIRFNVRGDPARKEGGVVLMLRL
jgi:hypothetical protein